MRNISFFATQQQIRNRSKTVTRRKGWLHMIGKSGVLLQGIEKGQGLPSGAKVVKMAVIELENVRREPIARMIRDPEYGKRECVLEGFPDLTPEQFVSLYCTMNKCDPSDDTTRLQFRYVDQLSIISAENEQRLLLDKHNIYYGRLIHAVNHSLKDRLTARDIQTLVDALELKRDHDVKHIFS